MNARIKLARFCTSNKFKNYCSIFCKVFEVKGFFLIQITTVNGKSKISICLNQQSVYLWRGLVWSDILNKIKNYKYKGFK